MRYCVQCKASFAPKRRDQIYCKTSCGAKSWYRKNSNRQKNELASRHCVICNSPYTATNHNAIYCGNACKLVAWKLKHGLAKSTKRAIHRKLLATLRRLLKAKIKAERQPTEQQAIAKQLRQDRIALRATKTCGGCNGPLPKSKSAYCSDICKPKKRYKQSAETRRNARRRQRKRYGKTWGKRARAYGVRYERISRHEVFHWDGWRCQICGIETPQSLDGSNCSNAPTIDHIIPISKGGHHLFANLQTACRSCNTIKGDRLGDVVTGGSPLRH
jgi:5-methylcytosine-specific restriction endonuclease McrA